jgi:hypothetical protein
MRWLTTILLATACSLLTATAQAVSISHTLNSLGGNQYRYDYTLFNDAPPGVPERGGQARLVGARL